MEGDWIIKLKSSHPSAVSNSKSISLSFTCGKTFERIVCDKIRLFLTKYNTPNWYEHGFKQRLSTVVPFVGVVHELCEILNRTGKLGVIFLDFWRAFDKIKKRKLLIMGSGNLNETSILSWIHSFSRIMMQFFFYYRWALLQPLVTRTPKSLREMYQVLSIFTVY